MAVEVLTVVVSGVVEGATLSDGSNSFTGTANDDDVDVSGWSLEDISVLPPLHDDGEFQLTVTATSSEDNPTSSDTTVNTLTASDSTTIDVQVDAVADVPNVAASSNVTTNEDTAVNLGISSSLVDTDGSEVLTVVVSGVVEGATLSDGSNSFTGTANDDDVDVSGWSLEDISVLPPLHDDGEFQLTVTATSSEDNPTSSDTTVNTLTASDSTTINVQVDAVADVPNLSVTSMVSGFENEAIPLAISSSLVDADGSESLLIHVSGVPTGGLLNQGTDNGGGNWTLTPLELTGLSILVPDDAAFVLIVTATTSETTPTSDDTSVAVMDADTVSQIGVTVNNVVPTIDEASLMNSSPECGMTHAGDPISVSVAFTDPGFDNLAGGTSETFTSSTIDWGDGTVETFPAIGVSETDGAPHIDTTGVVSGTHAYTSGGVYTVTITVMDDDGGSDVITSQVVTTGVGLVDGVLYVVGTEGDDKVDVKLKGSDGGPDQVINVKGIFDKKGTKEKFDVDYAAGDVQSIVILLCGGDDDANVHQGIIVNGVAIDALIDGGEGDDKLKGGSGNDTILGGSGKDDLKGYDGNDLIDGGSGDDKLQGGKGSDILLGGDGDDDLKAGSDGGTDGAADTVGDILSGGAGNDKLKGSKGMDILIGGLVRTISRVETATAEATCLSAAARPTIATR